MGNYAIHSQAGLEAFWKRVISVVKLVDMDSKNKIVNLLGKVTEKNTSLSYTNTMVNPENIDRQYWSIAIKVSEALEIPLNKIIGVRDTDEKLLACYMEMAISESTYPIAISKKYNINTSYLMNQLAKFENRFKKEEAFKHKYRLLLDAFFVKKS